MSERNPRKDRGGVMNKETKAYCSCLTVKYDAEPVGNVMERDRWWCVSCKTEFERKIILDGLRTQLATVTAERDAARGFARLWKRCAKKWWGGMTAHFFDCSRKRNEAQVERNKATKRATEAEARAERAEKDAELFFTKQWCIRKGPHELVNGKNGRSCHYECDAHRAEAQRDRLAGLILGHYEGEPNQPPGGWLAQAVLLADEIMSEE